MMICGDEIHNKVVTVNILKISGNCVNFLVLSKHTLTKSTFQFEVVSECFQC